MLSNHKKHKRHKLCELFAKFAAGLVILPADLRFCLFQYGVRPGKKGFLTTKSTNCVFVPFVAIPGKRHAAEFCKRLGTKQIFEQVEGRLSELITLCQHAWVVSHRSALFVPFVPLVAIPGNDPPPEFYMRPRYVLKAD